MSSWNPHQNDGNESDDEDEQTTLFLGRNAYLFLLDGKLFGNEADFKESLRLIIRFLKSKMLSNKGDLVSLIIYNTRDNPPPKHSFCELTFKTPSHMSIVIQLDNIAKEMIDCLNALLESDDFATEYGNIQNQSCHLVDAIWLSCRIIVKSPFKLAQRVLFHITNDDAPYELGSQEANQMFVRGKDLNELGVDYNLIQIRNDFEWDKFFATFICTVKESDLESFQPLTAEAAKDSLQYRADYRKRCKRYLKMTIGDGLDVGVGIYSFAQPIKMPKKVKLNHTSGQIVGGRFRTTVTSTDPDTMETKDVKVNIGELKKSCHLGGEELIFTSDEKSKMSEVMPVGLNIIGFKPLDGFDWRESFIQSCKFIYPSNNLIKNSTQFFGTLWKKCLEEKVYALGILQGRRNGEPRYVGLIPQSEKLDKSSGAIKQCDGFVMVYLNFSDEVRIIKKFEENKEDFEVPEEAASVFKRLVDKLSFKYDVENFECPSLAVLQSKIEGMAFETPIPEFVDNTMPIGVDQDDRMDALIPMIQEIMSLDVVTAEKRQKSAGTSEAGPSKRAKKDAMTLEDRIQLIRNGGTSDNVTVAEVKEYIRNVMKFPMKSSAKKADLIELIRSTK